MHDKLGGYVYGPKSTLKQNGIMPRSTIYCTIERANLKRLNYYDPIPNFKCYEDEKQYFPRHYVMRGTFNRFNNKKRVVL